MTFILSQHRVCSECQKSTEVILHRRQQNSGAFHYCWLCSTCGKIHRQNTRLWIPRAAILEHVKPEDIDRLPILPANTPLRCTRCGAEGAEHHHWAPKEIFGHDESDKWPGDFLCPKHHAEWHAKMNAARGKGTTP